MIQCLNESGAALRIGQVSVTIRVSVPGLRQMPQEYINRHLV